MKNLLFILLIFIQGLSISAQNLPNASFEDWHPYSLGEYPDFWTTSDSVSVALGGGVSVFKGSDPYDGALSLHMKSVLTGLGIKGPGIATNGIVTNVGVSFVFSGGTADTARSRFFSGYYKYTPAVPADAAVVKVYLLKDNTGIKDTIAAGYTELTDTTSSYTQFVTQLIYRDFIQSPDTCLIIFQSSRGLNDLNLGVGSEFVVDSIGFSGFVGVDEVSDNIRSVNLYPSPAKNVLMLDVLLKTKTDLFYDIYDLNGRSVLSSTMHTDQAVVDVSILSSGQYILNLSDAKKNPLYSTRFSIAR